MGYILDNDVKFLTGVGERRALLLQKELGIRTLGDLLYYFPFRYIDRSRIWRIGEIADDSLTYIQLRARITGFQHRFYIPVVSKLVNDPDKFICLRRHEPFFKTIQRTELSVNFYRKGTTGNNK